ncbi:MAG: hypothetical protein A2X56_01660 [Nitrospirae bacterium GWC2_57_13]|nr:MAG: hypothetical protein A2072_01660 [Nitrospirae bacterium GWC1_57_7]OGW26587.1 MAG: hypothetical protein A2X56_01660 [Nitrospirae bacterium GWC2_57_13]
MLMRLFKILLGLALIPACLGFTWQLGETVLSLSYKPHAPWYFLAGTAAYFAAHALFRRPIITYVFGHELTHALFAVLFGGSVKSFHASERGGRVTVTRTNVVITLAPYFFPLYTFAVLALYWLSRLADLRGAEGWLVLLAGATFAFHLLLTFIFLQSDQDDIREQGAIFSYPLIYLFNVVFAALLVGVLLSEEMDYVRFLAGGIIKSIDMVRRAMGMAAGLAQGL